jgi:hypothetical protein
MSCKCKRLYTRHGPPQLIALWRNLREYSMRQLPCRLIELILIFCHDVFAVNSAKNLRLTFFECHRLL